MAQLHDGITPRPRAEDISDVGNRVAQGVALFLGGQGIAQAAASPGGTRLEEGLQDLDSFLQDWFEGVDWGTAFAWQMRDNGDVEGNEVCQDFGRLRGIDGCYLTGGVD